MLRIVVLTAVASLFYPTAAPEATLLMDNEAGFARVPGDVSSPLVEVIDMRGAKRFGAAGGLRG